MTCVCRTVQETRSGRTLEKEVHMSPVGGIGEVKKVDTQGTKRGTTVIKKEE